MKSKSFAEHLKAKSQSLRVPAEAREAQHLLAGRGDLVLTARHREG
jgi:hypothetical protein